MAEINVEQYKKLKKDLLNLNRLVEDVVFDNPTWESGLAGVSEKIRAIASAVNAFDFACDMSKLALNEPSPAYEQKQTAGHADAAQPTASQLTNACIGSAPPLTARSASIVNSATSRRPNTYAGWRNLGSSSDIPPSCMDAFNRPNTRGNWSETMTHETAVITLRTYEDDHAGFIADAFKRAIKDKTKLPHFVLMSLFKADLLTHVSFMIAFTQLLGMMEDLVEMAPTTYAGLGMALAALVKGEVFAKEDLSVLYQAMTDASRVKLIIQVGKFVGKMEIQARSALV